MGNQLELEDYWWEKYSLKDAPSYMVNPHFESIWNQASIEKQKIALMGIGILREPNIRKREAKYNQLSGEMVEFNVYMPMSFKKFRMGGTTTFQIYASAIMEVYTPSGLYSLGR